MIELRVAISVKVGEAGRGTKGEGRREWFGGKMHPGQVYHIENMVPQPNQFLAK